MSPTSTTRDSTGSSNPEFVNARVRSRRAALFDDEDYRKLVRMGPGGIARFMEESEYETEINALASRHDGVDLIEYALNRNLAKHFDDLLRWAEGELHELIAKFLRRYDAWNVKTAIRGVYSGASPDEIRVDLIQAGALDDATLDRIVEADSIEEIVETLEGTIFGEPLEAAYDEFESRDVLVPLENAVDRAFYSDLLAGVEKGQQREGPTALYEEFLVAEIDFLNARNALRVARSGANIDPEEYAIEGGELFGADELRAVGGDLDQLVELLRESDYGDQLSTALDGLRDADSLIQFEHALDAALLEYTDHLSHVYPVSITAVMSYVLAKTREVENIRAIARGKEVGLDQQQIEDELVIL
ncbi:V-type ATP synthase subunit C [Salinarchaeum sp. Harcht-Bsk1]|uniref:V-type ATP synthase subunit C n=1 Tax=Salinarchaeum sp. Harcht-Bsk1 TaxID=1333523 RepID=UPI00034246CB|nr:V-type ATP synthase subunit C [Salinarchaeum sp. Harcht-Bsk1]AGN00313.1 V-type ATP synthase subunit C [Salinarchaeum sp. Harcht-Bsk1]